MSGIPGEESSRGSPCPRLIDGSVLPLQTHAGNCFVRNAWGSHYGRLALTWEVKLMLRHRMLFWVTIILSLELSLSNRAQQPRGAAVNESSQLQCSEWLRGSGRCVQDHSGRLKMPSGSITLPEGQGVLWTCHFLVCTAQYCIPQ